MAAGARLQALLRHEIDMPAENALEIGLQIEVAVKRGSTVEFDEDVDVAVRTQFITCGGAEEREPLDSIPLAHFCQVFREQAQDRRSVHGLTSTRRGLHRATRASQ